MGPGGDGADRVAAGTPPFKWGDPGTWDAALTGVDAAYVAFSPDLAMPGSGASVAALTRRAVEHGVRRLVLLSGRGEPAAQEAEALFAAAAKPAEWTVLRASWFSQDFSETFLAEGTRAGELALPVGDVPEPFVDAEDIADVAVAALTQDGHAGRTYELTGPRAITFDEAVRTIAAAARRDIRLVRISHDALRDGLTAEGVPPRRRTSSASCSARSSTGATRPPRTASGRPSAARRATSRSSRARPRRPARGGRIRRRSEPAGARPPGRAPAPLTYGSVPLPPRESAEGDEADQHDDDPEPEGPEDRHQDADDHDDPAEADPAEHVCHAWP